MARFCTLASITLRSITWGKRSLSLAHVHRVYDGVLHLIFCQLTGHIQRMISAQTTSIMESVCGKSLLNSFLMHPRCDNGSERTDLRHVDERRCSESHRR